MTDSEDMVVEGDDDSFEDSEGKPCYKLLVHYVTYKICQGVKVINNNGFTEQKKGASTNELGIFYSTHPKLIKEKQDKYEAYNKRRKKPLARDYIYSINNRDMYSFYGESLDKYMKENDNEYYNKNSYYQPSGLKLLSPNNIQALENSEERAQRILKLIKTKTLRIEDIRNEKELQSYFAYHIKYQDNAVKTIAHIIYGMSDNESDEGDDAHNANITSILSSGVSGTGKSEFIKLIRPLFHMEPGGTNEVCYAELLLATFNDGSHRNAINGPGPGYKGMSDPCLVDHLERSRIAIEERGFQQSQHPNVILVFIDELCKPKTEVGVLDSLNSLLSFGTLQRASGNIKFILPSNTKLLFYSTANYGESRIVHYEPKSDINKAENAIVNDMRRKRVPQCNIGRIGYFVPFFALSAEQAISIVRFNLDCYFDNTTVTRPFTMVGEDRTRFADFYFACNFSVARGMRAPIKKMRLELQHIRALKRHSPTHRNAKAVLRFDTIPHSECTGSLEELCERYPCLSIALSREDVDSDNIEDCILLKSDIGYASLCDEEGNPFIVYVSRPHMSQKDDDEDDEDDDSETYEKQDRVVMHDKEVAIRELLSNPLYTGNPLIAVIRCIMDDIPITPTVEIPLILPSKSIKPPLKRLAVGDIDEAVVRKKKKKDAEENTEEQSLSCSFSDSDYNRKICPECKNEKPTKQFEKKYNNSKGISKVTVCDTCSTCRRGAAKKKADEEKQRRTNK